MRRQSSEILFYLAVTAVLIQYPVTANSNEDQRPGYFSEELVLSDEDIRDITSQVMSRNPVLSSSPGIKAAGGTRHRGTNDVADVIYFPHIEHGGVKQAFQVRCTRTVPETRWACCEIQIRRYMNVRLQEFEVRVVGPISSQAALALIEAARKVLPPTQPDDPEAPTTAIMIRPQLNNDGYVITWGTSEGYARLSMKAQLTDGANWEHPDAWQLEVWWSSDKL